jgi:hypothetical protein
MTRPVPKQLEILIPRGKRYVKVPHFHQVVARTDENRLRALNAADLLLDVGAFRSAREMVRVKARITRWFNGTKDGRRTRQEPHPRKFVRYKLAGGRGARIGPDLPPSEPGIPEVG